ncbi:hypothetical protein PRZ48_002886 [Zasmidium cellare]|uniref:Fumarylacetoacetase-like C-terminal domain-containing protein n=1 Tax=Zasmidium cellare TaxID=395010 RepID=A0ABR0EVQ2_ZASCE|nr:hypothetical protein PRZ48_002886 [Zasmidium cellare]
MAYSRLIRFRADDLEIYFGEPEIDHASELLEKLDQGILHANPIHDLNPFKLGTTLRHRKRVKEIVPLLSSLDVPIVRCIGLNYVKHRHSGKNIHREDALDYVAGYVASNDVSAQTRYEDTDCAGPLPQWNFGKGFDKFAPLGPMLVTPRLVGDASNLRLQTWVNGELRQDANTEDLLFGVKDIIAFISQGTTLQKGTVILTGTPAGVAMEMEPTPVYLRDGDVVKVEIEQLGSVENRMAFE